MPHLALLFLLAAVLLAPFVSADITATIDYNSAPPPPASPWLTITPMTVGVSADCGTIPPCVPPFRINFQFVCGGTPVQETFTNVPPASRTAYTYYPNSDPACREPTPLNSIITITDTTGQSFFTQSFPVALANGTDTTPPGISWNPVPPPEYDAGATISFGFTVTDPDDNTNAIPTLYPNVATAEVEITDLGNGQVYGPYDMGPFPPPNGWSTQVFHIEGTPSADHTVEINCSRLNCVGDLQIKVRSHDPAGLGITLPPMIVRRRGGLVLPSPILGIIPPAPVCPNAAIRAMANQPSGSPAIDSHEYSWSITPNPPVQIDTVPDTAKTGATSDTFDCAARNCQNGQTVSVSVLAIAGAQRSPPNATLILVDGSSLDCRMPAAPLLTNQTISISPFNAIVLANQSNNDPRAVLHRYVWTMADGTVIESPLMPLPIQNVTSAPVPCAANPNLYCPSGGTVLLTVYSYTAQNVQSQPAFISILIPARSALNPPVVVTKPFSPYDNDTIVLVANNQNEEVDRHQYRLLIINADGTIYQEIDAPIYDTVSTTAADKHTTTSKPFTCTTSVCRGRFANITARAYNSLGWSDWSPWLSVPFGPPPIPAPILVRIDPIPPGNSMLSDINSGLGALLNTSLAYSFTITPPAGQPPFNDYIPTLTVNGADAPVSSSRSGNNLIITLACTPSSCPNGSILTYKVIGVQAGANSTPLYFSLVVPQASGMPAQVGVICSGAELQRWLQVMAIGMMALLALIALVYMIGEALHHPQLLEWSKSEIGHVGMTIILFFLIVWLIQFQCNLTVGEFLNWSGSSNPLYSSGMTLSQAGLKSLEWGITQTRLTLVAMRYEMGVLNMRATYSSYSTQFPGMGGNGYSFMPFSGDYTLLGSFGMLTNLNSTFLLALLFQLFSLFFFSSSSGLFIFLVPVGLILRSVPFIRGFGGSLVAIGIGFYIFYPILLAFTGLLLAPLYSGIDSTSQLGIADASQLEAKELAIHTPFSSTGLAGDNIFSYNPGDPYPGPLMPTAGKDSPPKLGIYFNLTALNFLRAILIPTAGLIVTVSFVRDLAAIFGEEVDASKLIAMI